MEASMFRGDPARTGAHPGDFAPVTWTFRTSGVVKSSPTPWGPNTYVADLSGQVWALDTATGKLVWSFHADGAIDGSITVSGDLAYFGTANGNLYALSVHSGGFVWGGQTRQRSGMSTPAVGGGLVVVGGPNCTLAALSADTGREVWAHLTDMPLIPSQPDSPRSPGPLHSSPLIVDDVVYVCDGRLLAIDLASGDLRWRSSALASSTSSAAMADGLVYAAELDAVCAVEPSSGQVRWRTNVPDAHLLWSTPAVADGSVVVCAREQLPGGPLGIRLGGGVVAALDAVTGALRWRVTTTGPVGSAAALDQGTAYVHVAGQRPHILALDLATGAVQTQRPVRAPASPSTPDLISSPARTGDLVCVGLLSGDVSCFPADLAIPRSRGWLRKGRGTPS
jgi:outer membrane protein assembly factor BamB